MVTIDLSYYTTRVDGNKTDWFKLVSEGGYVSECRLRTGDEDQRVVELFLAFTNPLSVNVNFLNGVDNSRKLILEGRVGQYLSSIVQKI